MADGGKVVCDVAGIIGVIERIGGDTVDGSARAMGEGAKRIRTKAKDYAPVDKHNLENAIEIDASQSRGEGGRFGRKVFYVYVDDSKLPNDRYATIMHEELAPFGSGSAGSLGKGSIEKDGGSGKVGGKFLERAFEEEEAQVIRDVENLIEGMFR